MKLQSPFRPATLADCYTIAELFGIASDGVANYVWSQLQGDYPGLSLIEIGAKRYASDQSVFSYRNCVVAESEGEITGMMVTFSVEQPHETKPSSEAIVSEPAASAEEPDVLAPYSLEAPGTWYICAVALFPQFRNRGLGTQFLEIARQQAREHGFQELSLLCFEQNTGAKRLYERNGFQVRDRATVVPHEFIHYTGDVLLMTAPV